MTVRRDDTRIAKPFLAVRYGTPPGIQRSGGLGRTPSGASTAVQVEGRRRYRLSMPSRGSGESSSRRGINEPTPPSIEPLMSVFVCVAARQRQSTHGRGGETYPSAVRLTPTATPPHLPQRPCPIRRAARAPISRRQIVEHSAEKPPAQTAPPNRPASRPRRRPS